MILEELQNYNCVFRGRQEPKGICAHRTFHLAFNRNTLEFFIFLINFK